MKGNQAPRKTIGALLDAQDALKDLEIATCLLTALEEEIDNLVGIETADPRRVCERAGFLLNLFHERELIPAINLIDKALEEATNNLREAEEGQRPMLKAQAHLRAVL